MDEDRIALRKQLRRMVELYRWADEQWETLPLPDAIESVEERRQKADSDDLPTLTLALIHLLSVDGREAEAIRIADEMIARMPDDIRFPLKKATLHLYWTNDLEKALEAINAALLRARRTGFFRREALGVKGRILLKLGLGDQLTRTLEEIMSLEMKQDTPDTCVSGILSMLRLPG
jgi:tetratricopeptide (TPR) repeat protein